MTRKTLTKQANNKGTVFALVSDGVTFEVWKLCENYNAQCKNGLKLTWRYVQKGMTEADAAKLFEKRVGKQDALTKYYSDRAASGLATLSK